MAAAIALGMLHLGAAGDSDSYLEASRQGWLGLLGGVRSFGYPLFLKVVQWVSPRLSLLPLVQMGLHVAVVFFLYGALRRFGAAGWQSFALAGAFLVTLLNDPSSQCIMSDFLGRVLSAGVLASLFWVAADRPGRMSWIALGAFLLGAWAVRPLNVIWVVLAPFAGVILYLMRPKSEPATKRAAWPFVLRLAAVALLPLVAFCGLRLWAVNDFGVASFGGYQASGLAVGLLDPSLVEKVPADVRPLAQALLAERQRKGVPAVVGPRGIDMGLWKRDFNIDAWEIAAPVAAKLYGQDTVLANRRLGELSRFVLRRYLRAYLFFALTNLWESLGGLLRFGLVLQAFLAIAIVLYSARLLASAWLGRMDYGMPRPGTEAEKEWVVHNGFALAALSYGAVSAVLVALASVNVGRYSIAAGIFFPSLAAEWAFREGRTLWGYFQCRRTIH
ncbi:MAG: hypothetical protein WBS54_05445 [Acidobacteriota bacterium]